MLPLKRKKPTNYIQYLGDVQNMCLEKGNWMKVAQR